MSLAVELVVKGTSRNRTGATVIQTPEATITPWLHRMPCRNRTGSNRVAGGHATTTSMAYHSCRSSCSREGATAESNRVLGRHNPRCSQYTSCPELPLPDSNRGRPRDNRPCYPYTKGDRTPSVVCCRSSCRRSCSDLVVDPPPTGTRPQEARSLM